MHTRRLPAFLLPLLTALLLMFTAHASALVAIPKQTARVMDTAAMLTPEQRDTIEAKLAQYEAAKGTQIAVLTVPSTAPEVIEQYGIRVAEAWKTGRKGISDGAIVIIAPNNPRDLRRIRIEVGYGLEGAIPDIVASRIINEDLAPRFRQNDYYGGLVAALDHIRAVLEKEPLPEPAKSTAKNDGEDYLGLIFFLIVAALIVLPHLRRNRMANLGGRGGNVGSAAAGAILGALLSRGGRGGGGFGGGGGGGFGGGGGGGFGGGGASGDW